MYEIIWSNFENKHIIRTLCSFSVVPALFIGTHDECQAKLKNYISH
jgi:hypothetical protein